MTFYGTIFTRFKNFLAFHLAFSSCRSGYHFTTPYRFTMKSCTDDLEDFFYCLESQNFNIVFTAP